MPRAAPSACIDPGCAKLATKGSRCEDHTKEYKRDYTRTDTSEERKDLNKFYSSRAWRALSVAVRKRHPLCVRCADVGVVRPADLVDHIKPVRVHPELRLDVTNLQPLCNSCHNRKTAEDKALYKLI